MAYFNLLRTLFGAGMLGIPLAISQAGMLFGTVMNLATGVIMVYAHFNLLWCLNEISRQLRIPYVSYRYGFRIALLNGPRLSRTIGRHGPCIIATFMFLSQVGICTVFVIFTTDSLRDIMDWDSSRPALYCLYLPYTFLLFYMKNLKHIAYVSLAGNVMNLIGLFLVVYHMATSELPGNFVKFGNESPTALMFALGTMMFNMSAVAVILSIDKASPHPESLIKRCGVIEIGIIVPTILSTIFGCYGYYSFGTMEENILRSLPFDDDSAILAISLYMIAIMLAYPIQSFPGIEIALDVYKHLDIIEAGEEEVRLAGAILRPAFVFLTFLVAGLVPFQGPFVAFVGNSCTSLLALVFPAMMQLCIMYPGPYGPYKIYLIKNIFFIILGFLMCTVGAGTCGYLIYIRMMYINAEE